MSRRNLSGDDAPGPDNDYFVAGPPGHPSDEDGPEVVDKPARWWTKELGSTPVVAVGLAIGTVVVIVVILAISHRESVPPQQNFIV